MSGTRGLSPGVAHIGHLMDLEWMGDDKIEKFLDEWFYILGDIDDHPKEKTLRHLFSRQKRLPNLVLDELCCRRRKTRPLLYPATS